MGCSAAKNLTIEPLDNNKVTELITTTTTTNNNHKDESRKVSIQHSVSDVPPLEGVDPQTELLENGTVNNVQKGANGLSFEIAFAEDGDDDGGSIIKKHPPKRLQRLEEQQTSPKVALMKLQERLDEAEIRRQQILQQRIQSAKYRHQLKKQTSNGTNSDEDQDHLKVPVEVPKPGNPYDVAYI